MWKTLIAQFINTSLSYYVINYIFPMPIWTPQGIVFSLSMMLIALSVFQLASKILNVNYWCWKFSTWMKFRNGPLEAPVFQDNLNASLELPPYEIGSVYLGYLLNAALAGFYAYIAPWGSLLVALCTLIGYFIDKCILTQHSSLKTHYSYELSTESLKLFEFTAFFFVLGHVLFSLMFHGPSWVTWLALGLSILYPIIINNLPPFLYIRMMSTWLRCEKFSFGYCEDNHRFDFTYLNSNPLTRFSGNDHVEKAQEYIRLEEAQKYLQQMPKDQEDTIPKYDPVAMSQQ